VDDDALLVTLRVTTDAIRAALDLLDDWGLAGTRPGQYHADLAADGAAIGILEEAGLGVLSEETGLHGADRELLAVIDPVDGSTNASRALPWFATSICVVDAEGPRVAVVVNQATGMRWEAVRGRGARRDGHVVGPSAASELRSSLVALSGYPRQHLGWRQYRALGAAALDMCAVASGHVDAYADCTGQGAHGVWDYLGAALVCQEAGAAVADAFGRDLVTRDPEVRRCPVAAATPALLEELSGRVRSAFEKTP
jgi:fructose-1,6-bisphosphatase/inositol monophosphatase family enzyme